MWSDFNYEKILYFPWCEWIKREISGELWVKQLETIAEVQVGGWGYGRDEWKRMDFWCIVRAETIISKHVTSEDEQKHTCQLTESLKIRENGHC
jgi:hypothetical protein